MEYSKNMKNFRSVFQLLITVALFLLIVVLYLHISRFQKWINYSSTRGSDLSAGATSSSGSATSGKLFQGLKVRSFPKHEIKFSEDSDTLKKSAKTGTANRPSWAHQRLECKKWSVTTTIFEVSDAVKKQMDLPPDWCLVIVGDRKGLEIYPVNQGKKGRVIYLNVRDQEQLASEGVKLSEKMPWNHFGRKNLGFLYAIASGAELIWDFDDDNTLLSTPPKIMEPVINGDPGKTKTVLRAVSKNTQKTCNSFNPMPIMGAEQLPSWPRGLPLVDIKTEECQADAYQLEKTEVPEKKIAVYQSLANHDPDVDAIYRLTRPLPFDFKPVHEKLSLMIPNDAFAPFNAQATLFTYEAFFMLFLPVTVHGRVSDIWRSYFGQKLLKDSGYNLVFTPAQVVQYRNVHNYLADFDSEMDLYMKSGKLVEFLRFNFTSNCKQSLECHFEAIIISLYEHDYLQIQDIYHIQTWIKSLLDYGYKFPKLDVKSAK